MKVFAILLFASASVFTVAADTDWITDYEEAKKLALEDSRYVLINFTGSDWCGWCKRLKREIFTKSEFKDFAQKNLVLLELDFPRYTKQPKAISDKNDRLAYKYNVGGFPTILLLDPSSKVVMRTGYRRGGAEGYITYLKSRMSGVN